MRDSHHGVTRRRHTNARRGSKHAGTTAHAGNGSIASVFRSEPGDGALPIVIGVTGHRDLRDADIARLERIVDSLLADVTSEYPLSPLVILSPLAEGADRLVARVALARGARLIVPLPFEHEQYKRDFETSASRDEFDALIALASHHFVVTGDALAPNATVDTSSNDRSKKYARVGALIAQNSQILIAMWDGEERRLEGGTSEIVRYRLEGPPLELATNASLLDAPLNGPVFHIVTPTQSKPVPIGEPFSLRKIFPTGFATVGHAADTFNRILGRIEQFNRDERALHDHLASARERSRSYVFPTDRDVVLEPALQALLERYTTADSLAGHFQRHTLTALRLLIVGVFIGVLFFETYGHVAYNQHWMLGTYLGALLITWLYHRVVRRAEFQTKYLDYRSLAEGLRVQFFWSLAGVNENVADYYMRKQRTVLDWIRDAIQTWTIEALADRKGAVPTDASRIEMAVKHWVDGEVAYFERASARTSHQVHRFEHIADRLFIAALVIATAQLIWHRFLLGQLELGHFPLLAVGICLLTGGVIHGYVSKRALPELSKQFEQMAALYSHAQRHLHRLMANGEYDAAKDLLKELGVEALVENGDWLLLHRERPVEFSKGH